MAESSTIGAAFGQYTGDPNLGGGTLGVAHIDTKPIEDFAKYAMLYNKAEYDQRQKDAEKIADELAKFAALDLSTSIPKHAKILQEKYDALYEYAKTNPDALNYKSGKYLDFKKKQADLMNDINFAKRNSLLNLSRKQQIADEPDEKIKAFLQEQLDKEIETKGIRDTLDYQPKFDMTLPDWGQNKGQSLMIFKKEPNQDQFLDHTIFNREQANKESVAYSIGLSGIDQKTTSGKLKEIKLKDNSLIKAADIFNSAVANAKSTVDTTKTEAEQTEETRSKLSGLGIMKSIDQFNKYMGDMRTEIAAGKLFKDKFGNRLDAADYTDINWEDGISPEEISLLAQFTGWNGDKMGIREVQTNDALEWARLAKDNRALDLAEKKMNKEDDQTVLDATAVLNDVSQQTLNGEKRVQKNPDGTTNELRIISDPNLLKLYGTLDKEGNVTNSPDRVDYNVNQNKYYLRYFKKDKKGNTIVLSDGGHLLDTEKDQSIEPTVFLTTIVRNKFPSATNTGQVGTIVNGWYESSGNNLLQMATNYDAYRRFKTGQAGQPTTTVTQGKTSTSASDKTRTVTGQKVDEFGVPIKQ